MNFRHFVITALCFGALPVWFACSSGRDDTAVQQLLEQQKKTEQEKSELVQQLADVQAEISQLNARQISDQIAEVDSQANHLQAEVESLKDSLGALGSRLDSLSSAIDLRNKQIDFVLSSKTQARKRLRTSVARADVILDSLEDARTSQEKTIPVNEELIAIADKKVDAYEEEIKIYQGRKAQLLRKNASDEEIAAINGQIEQVRQSIKSEKDKKDQARLAIQNAQATMSIIDRQMEEFNTDIEGRYNEKATVEAFIEEEANRLTEETKRLEGQQGQLIGRRGQLQQEIEDKTAQLAALNERSAMLKTALAEIEPQAPAPAADSSLAAQSSPATGGGAEKDGGKPSNSGPGSGTILILFLVTVALLTALYLIGKRARAKRAAGAGD